MFSSNVIQGFCVVCSCIWMSVAYTGNLGGTWNSNGKSISYEK